MSEIYPCIGCSHLDMAMWGLRMVNQKLGVIFRKIYLLNIPSILDFPKFCLTQFFQLAHFSALPWRGASRAGACTAILNFFLNFLKELVKVDIFIRLSLLRWPFQDCGGACGVSPKMRARRARFILLGSFSDNLLVVSILDIVYNCHL